MKNNAPNLAAEKHRHEMTSKRVQYMRKRQKYLDALSKTEREEYDIAKASLKKSFLAIVHLNPITGTDGKTQALAVRALNNMTPFALMQLYHQEIPTQDKMLAAAHKQMKWDQMWKEEHDPKYHSKITSIIDKKIPSTFTAKSDVKKELQDFYDRRAYITAYQKVEEEIHNLVTPPYNGQYYNLDKLNRMTEGLDCIPPQTLLRWTKRHMLDDVALMCDVVTLGLQAQKADSLAKQPIKTASAIALAGASATTYALTKAKKAHDLGLGLAFVAGLLACASLIKFAKMKSISKKIRKNRQAQINLYDLKPMVKDLEQNTLSKTKISNQR